MVAVSGGSTRRGGSACPLCNVPRAPAARQNMIRRPTCNWIPHCVIVDGITNCACNYFLAIQLTLYNNSSNWKTQLQEMYLLFYIKECINHSEVFALRPAVSEINLIFKIPIFWHGTWKLTNVSEIAYVLPLRSLFSLYGQWFPRYRHIFKIAPFVHEAWPLKKVPNVSYVPKNITLFLSPQGRHWAVREIFSMYKAIWLFG